MKTALFSEKIKQKNRPILYNEVTTQPYTRKERFL